jgi:Lrp/AsnC family transcriptional regulator for asnA, asnC and gidA
MARIDHLDLKIVSELSKNGRVSISELANETGITRQTIANRMKRLHNEDIIRVAGGLSLVKLGYEMATVGMEVRGEEVEGELMKLMQCCPRVLTIFRAGRKEDLQISMWGENQKSIDSTIESFNDFQGVTVASTHYLGKPIHGSISFTMDPKDSTISPCGKDCSKCLSYSKLECPGCPDTSHYRNPEIKKPARRMRDFWY